MEHEESMMTVDVFVSVEGEGDPLLLILPFGQARNIPPFLGHMGWRHLATTSSTDQLLVKDAEQIEAGLARDGYTLIAPLTYE
jgi:hypothetical protein